MLLNPGFKYLSIVLGSTLSFNDHIITKTFAVLKAVIGGTWSNFQFEAGVDTGSCHSRVYAAAMAFPILGCCDVEHVQVRSEGNDKVVGKSRAKYSLFSLQNFA